MLLSKSYFRMDIQDTAWLIHSKGQISQAQDATRCQVAKSFSNSAISVAH